MSDWKKYKGEGPWDFTPSHDKPRYNEGSHISDYRNPVWDLNRVIPANPVTPWGHNPDCGYWTREYAPTPESEPGEAANIFGLFSAGASIWGCYWDGINSLTYTGYYNPNDGEELNCLIIDEIDDTLITVGGEGSTASIRKIGTTPAGGVFPLDTEIFPFNDYDVTNPTVGDMVRHPDTGDVYYGEGAFGNGEGGTLLKLDGTTYTKDLRSYLGTVVTGTDSNLYIPDVALSSWHYQKKPITGVSWDGFNSKIPDNYTDGGLTVWGNGTCLTNYASEFRIKWFSDQIWAVLTASPTTRFRNYWPTDLHVTKAVNAIGHAYDFVGYDGYVYSVEGSFNCTLRKYTAGFMVLVDELILSPGRADEIIEMDGRLIVLNDPYTAHNVLYKINPSTLNIENSYEFPDTDLWQRIIAIDDRYLAIGGNQYAMVFDVISWQIMDTVAIDDDAIGYATQVMAVQNL